MQKNRADFQVFSALEYCTLNWYYQITKQQGIAAFEEPKLIRLRLHLLQHNEEKMK